MKCTFVAMGAENMSLEALSGFLKQHGHQTTLAYDQALFDDKNYFFKPRLAKFFDHTDVVVGQVVKSKPDLVAISVMTPTYQWALNIARRIKEVMDVPIIFGGIHPTTSPDHVMSNDCVDMVCMGEGEFALLDLAESIDRGDGKTDIKNIWFKRNGQVIKNPQRSPIANLDELPFPDKELFAPHIPIKNSYLAVTARGCPFTCSFCSLSFYAEEAKTLGSKRLRERSVPAVISELEVNLKKYNYKWIEFRNNTFTANRKWVRKFCEEYKTRIKRPFLAFAHPTTMDEEVASLMKEAGCYAIQLGIESFDENVRKEILNRRETNDDILRAVEAMDKVGLTYSMDYILGLPSQTEEELMTAAAFFIEREHCHRISPFMLAYLPKLDIVKHGLKYGDITEEDVKAMEAGDHDHYVSAGSMGRDPRKYRLFMSYRLFFRLIPLIPKSIGRFILKKRLFKIFPYLPMSFVLDIMDIMQAIIHRDLLARTYANNYLYWFTSRFNKDHPAYRGNQNNDDGNDSPRPRNDHLDMKKVVREL